MTPKTEDLTAEESLQIITNMINQAKGNIQRNADYFLLWGWVVAIGNLGMYILIKAGYEYPYLIWTITIPAWIYTIYKSYKKGKSASTATHLNRISAWLWLAFGVCIFTLTAFGWRINYQLNPVILLFSAIPTFVSGIILRFKPFILGGISFWVFAVISFLITSEIQFLLGAISIVCGFIIPGYLLKRMEDK